ncbi:unnamed protein product [Paramecium primaurelia]|uniref:Uncharacterized protein n=1 Tax=Paramecium primaurelia TaxID=5886 RepID=A0A8S1MWQ1_PARPR|nr:unnamed protein product [Paramecium primaurelia]
MNQRVGQQDESCIKKKIIKSTWNTKEDNLLKKGIQICGINWIAIAQYLPNRNPNQCAQRWKRLQGNRSRTNQFWSPEEDVMLLQLISQFGKQWSKIAKIFQNRSGKQCRNRFVNTLDPKLKQHSFTQEEDQLIYEYYLEFGPKWSQISKFIEGRSDNQIKNRFYNHIRTEYLQIQNPYYTKQTHQKPKESLIEVREEHLRQYRSLKKLEKMEDQNDHQTKEEDLFMYTNEENCSDLDLEMYSNIGFQNMRYKKNL